MTCELIRIDFKNQTIRSRELLKEAEYDPSKCEHFAALMDSAAQMAVEAYKVGVDPQRMVILLSNPENNYGTAVYDPSHQDMITVTNSLDFMASKFIRIINEEQD